MKRKIAYVINTIVKGGPSSVVLGMIHELDREKYIPMLITLFTGNDEKIVAQLRNDNVEVVECKNNSRLKYISTGLSEYSRIIKINKVDIVHSHGFVPDVMTARLKLPLKKISTVHNIMFNDYPHDYGVLKSKVYIAVHIKALNKIDRAVCCSQSIYDVMRNYLKECAVIKNGIEDLKFNSEITRQDIGIPDNAVVFMYAGNLSKLKRVTALVENFKKYHGENEYLLMLGEGPEKEECNALKDDNVIFMGFQKNPYEYMMLSNIYTSASSSEGFSISVLEALHCGLGLFLSDIPSHKEVLENSEGVYLGECFDIDDFGGSYSKIISNIQNIDREKIGSYQRGRLSAAAKIEAYQTEYEDL